MRQIEFATFGAPEVLSLVERKTPTPGPGEILVGVKAIGVNFADTLMRQNRYAVTPALPAVPGTEVAGVVEAIGAGVTSPAVGTRVAVPLFATGAVTGGYSDYVVVSAALAAPLPDGLGFEAATALMIQGLTALYLTRQFQLKDKTVLVNAAAGGVGSLLVQLARRTGARAVIAAASTAEKLSLARSLGADHGVNYSVPDWSDEVRAASVGPGPDVIFESVGGDVIKECLKVLAPGGEIIVYGALNIQSFDLGVPELINLIFKNQSLTGFALPTLLTPDGLTQGLSELFDLAVRGELRVQLSPTFALKDAALAHHAMEARKTTGKVVIAP
jgi:NADPH2:quinone reductase